HPEKLSRPPLPPDEPSRSLDIITFITEDHTGAIWFGTLWNGLSRYDPVTQKVSRYRTVNDNGYHEGITFYAFVSREGVLWISDQPKLYSVDLSRKVIKQTKIIT